MNDFTKDELKTLHRLIDDDIDDDSGYIYVTNYHDKLREKIQSLIDNYCEHDYSMEYTPHRMCSKCGNRK